MRAVNLIPVDQRRGGGGTSGRSGSGVYVVLGVLGAVVIAMAAYVLTSNAVNHRKAELANVTSDADRVEAQARALKPYSDFATLRQQRLQTVSALATSRFDWERTIHQLSQVLPAGVSLTSFVGTVAPGVTVEGGGGGGGGSTIRGAMNGPAVELVGCASSQSDVSRVMSRLRRMSGVIKVSLSSSQKPEPTATAAPSASASGATGAGADCTSGNARRPQFNITVFFAPLPGAATGSAPGAPAAPGSPAPAPAGGQAQPAPAASGGSGATP